MRKIFLTILISSAILVTSVAAQQSAEMDDWRAEYQSRIRDTIRHRQAQRPESATDSQFTRPDYVVYIPKVEPETLGDCYNDHFQVFDGPDGTLYALTCQATCEGAPDQHVTFFRSTDHGKTWTAPKVLAGPATMEESKAKSIASWGFPLVSRSGRIYVVYDQYVPGKVSTNRQHTGVMTGIYSDDHGETWSDPEMIAMPRTKN
ncbi:MAG: sialidase family protein, partial [Planctomycetia bacterium]|nr:sialidase family protein [Planctomycetia bacterium]